jgi:hypothetical protein
MWRCHTATNYAQRFTHLVCSHRPKSRGLLVLFICRFVVALHLASALLGRPGRPRRFVPGQLPAPSAGGRPAFEHGLSRSANHLERAQNVSKQGVCINDEESYDHFVATTLTPRRPSFLLFHVEVGFLSEFQNPLIKIPLFHPNDRACNRVDGRLQVY